MADIRIKRGHGMALQEAHGKVEDMARKLARELGASYRWEGEVLSFKRSGANGSIALKPGELDIAVELGLMLRPLKSSIEKSINHYLDQAVG